jgi:hypothetical protein
MQCLICASNEDMLTLKFTVPSIRMPPARQIGDAGESSKVAGKAYIMHVIDPLYTTTLLRKYQCTIVRLPLTCDDAVDRTPKALSTACANEQGVANEIIDS